MIYESGVNPAISPAWTWVKHSPRIVNHRSLRSHRTNRALLKCRRTTLGDRTCKRKVRTEGMRELSSDTKFTPKFTGGPQSGRKQEAGIVLGSTPGRLTDWTRFGLYS